MFVKENFRWGGYVVGTQYHAWNLETSRSVVLNLLVMTPLVK